MLSQELLRAVCEADRDWSGAPDSMKGWYGAVSDYDPVDESSTSDGAESGLAIEGWLEHMVDRVRNEDDTRLSFVMFQLRGLVQLWRRGTSQELLVSGRWILGRVFRTASRQEYTLELHHNPKERGFDSLVQGDLPMAESTRFVLVLQVSDWEKNKRFSRVLLVMFRGYFIPLFSFSDQIIGRQKCLCWESLLNFSTRDLRWLMWT
ncbi:hypothetical protein F511_37989 [Dorcoceras hygrometricum]|uniref:Uncharacterized protein n=1 Tax=Dorcoceras hygrometricum TaxID=472368 RepID=A0A2Z7BBC5_9LAMI|nr:hypothetical protein F511_37989 [Dorcoceras hygrometricum]